MTRDRIIEPDQAAVDKQQHRKRDHRLAHRIHIDQGLLDPRPGTGGVRPTLTQIHHPLAVAQHAEGGTAAGMCREHLPDDFISGRHEAVGIIVR
nr:hypothetical protein GCM10020092_000020 [Actinoplanes digitatis]